MSLRAIHVVFILASIVVSFVFTAWCVSAYKVSGGKELLWMGGAAAAAGLALVVYLPGFLRKTKGLNR